MTAVQLAHDHLLVSESLATAGTRCSLVLLPALSCDKLLGHCILTSHLPHRQLCTSTRTLGCKGVITPTNISKSYIRQLTSEVFVFSLTWLLKSHVDPWRPFDYSTRCATRQGLTVEDLIQRSKEKETRERNEQLEHRKQLDRTTTTSARGYASAGVPVESEAAETRNSFRASRKDSSPVKVCSHLSLASSHCLTFDSLCQASSILTGSSTIRTQLSK